MTIKALRTPESRFSVLPAFPFQPQYVEDLAGFESLRMAYIDEGDKSAEYTFLCLHGEPTWSYLYRKMIPVFTQAGHRVVAPDLFGFGRSDKPVDDATYHFTFHRDSIMRLIERLDLKNIVLVCQDWGGFLGLTIPMDMQDRFKKLIVMNTGVSNGQPLSESTIQWMSFTAAIPEMPVGGLIACDAGAAVNVMDVIAYDAPFPDNSYKAGVRRFPQMIPTDANDDAVKYGLRAIEFLSQTWEGESFMAIGMKDVILGEPAMMALKGVIKGCPEPMKIAEAGHFVQEYGVEVAENALLQFGLAAK
ncbi:haloalkane dehalogenase [Shewanella litoralis]|uniref:Haloalkane dehalogenase 1 n=1 Tax=Shewanella litoralis TaxID=2282700 RepID=A0ABQ2QYW2_9GAMM|nr:haloalkane dehalogenase [Shewanella litoralis]GGQ04808.1 haloalkane dehalogenase 1 [Shewanella litoralis]